MKTLFFLVTLLLSTQVSAEGCWPLYEAEASRINERDGYKQRVGGQPYVTPGGQLGWWPGIEVSADIDNWAEDMVLAIKYGPMIMFSSRPDPRREFLEAMQSQISEDCQLADKKEKFEGLRELLTRMMNEGDFCPGGNRIETRFFSRWSQFKKTLRSSLAQGKFQELCQGPAVVDDSNREVKDVTSRERGAEKPSSARGQ